MAKYEQKLVPTDRDVDEFLAGIENERRRADAIRLREIMEEVSGEPAVLWEYGILGVGHYHYRYESGHEGDAGAFGFAPRKANLVIYVVGGLEGHEDVLARLGKHKIGKSCLYITRLANIDEGALRELIQISIDNAARIDAEARS